MGLTVGGDDYVTAVQPRRDRRLKAIPRRTMQDDDDAIIRAA